MKTQAKPSNCWSRWSRAQGCSQRSRAQGRMPQALRLFLSFRNKTVVAANSDGCRPSQLAELVVVGFHPSRRFQGEPQTHCFGDCIECREARIAVGRQCAIQTFAFDSSSFGDLGDASRLGHVAQGEEENARFVRFFQSGPEIFSGKLWVFAYSSSPCNRSGIRVPSRYRPAAYVCLLHREARRGLGR